ncbi:MAG: fructose-1,6-bisphosphatase, partial [Parasporobacterium sp.]|nr:fructose-1,6-bisphosphatase [Parasporobacterium sp.]
MNNMEYKFLSSLSEQFPTIGAAATEIINLSAILSLPKSTEHFVTDIHGEYDQFMHIMKNGSGAIRRKIDEALGDETTEAERKELAALVYYPKRKLKQLARAADDLNELYTTSIIRLIKVCRHSAMKYTRSKVRKAMDPEFQYITEELMFNRFNIAEQAQFADTIMKTIIEIGGAHDFIVSLAVLIRRLAVDHLHVVGDIFDRGPLPHLIMDELMAFHSVDIQWGNHDIIWMGAAMGNNACIANVVRIAARYANLDILEDAYGINFLPLAKLAMEVYADDDCEGFFPEVKETDPDYAEAGIIQKIHKAIAVIQFKLEAQLIKEYPWFGMEHRLLLHTIDLEKGTVEIEGKTYNLNTTSFPTLMKDDPYALTPEEQEAVTRLNHAFTNCEKLKKHVDFLFAKGSFYNIYNGNLMYHGCMPVNEDGTFAEVEIAGEKYKGKALYDKLDKLARQGYYSLDPAERKLGTDIMLYIWESRFSPVFGKDKMTTFERYFIDDKETHIENKNPYYSMIDDEVMVRRIFDEFGIDWE